MTSYQKKLLVIIACLSLFLFYSYYFHQQIPSNSMVDTNDHQARPRKIRYVNDWDNKYYTNNVFYPYVGEFEQEL